MDTGQVQAGRSTTRNPAAQLALLASDGATSTTVVGEQLRQLHRLELVPTLATVTMGGNDLLLELNQALRTLAEEHQALVADVHGRFLGHGLAIGDPAEAHPRPSNRDLWYCGLIEPNAWGANEIRATFWEILAIDGDRERS